MGPLLDWIERHIYPVLAGVLVLVVLGGTTVFARQAGSTASLMEQQAAAFATRAATQEVRAVAAEASLTAIAQQQIARQTAVAAESATAVALATATATAVDPRSSLERALGLVFAAYKEPTQQRVQAMEDAISPDVMPVFRPQIDRLQAINGKLGANSSYKVEVLSVDRPNPDRAEIRTSEAWVYDERDRADQPVRCVREESEQTYVMVRDSGGWLVQQFLPGATRRASC